MDLNLAELDRLASARVLALALSLIEILRLLEISLEPNHVRN